MMDGQKRKAPMRLLRYMSANAVEGELFEMFNYSKYKYVIRENSNDGFKFFNTITKDEAMEVIDERIEFWKKDGISIDIVNEVSLN